MNAIDVVTGFHPDGYRIDTTASPMNRYTKWDIENSRWCNPKPVCFDSLPAVGWVSVDEFNWDDEIIEGITF